ncbi:cytochrome c [Skermanella rosea]|uniref:c-type cytochrome n=1 Tax=Skermanella rosea TaxID=1817965 RepID=UPI0019333FFA|nr:cytochrome c [Skermanella rosea]UEM01797.1 cytochrome c [Skermanella rosea]
MRPGSAAITALMLVLAAGCDNLAEQPRSKTWEPAADLPSRERWPLQPPEHTVAREDVAPPVPALDAALLARGHERYDVYCSPCHGFQGEGDGMIVKRGFPAPPSFHIDRLRSAPTRHFYDVVTDGWGVMYSYADRVQPPDRWAIAAYVRVLQESRSADVAELPEAAREKLE